MKKILITEKNFHLAARDFLERLAKKLEEQKVILEPHWQADHICYRVETNDRYLEVKKDFLSFSKLLIEAEVSGRMISTFKLHKAIKFNNWKISVVELPAPKKNKDTPEGFEHIEIVCDVPFADLKKRFSHCHLDESGLKKSFNQELEVIFGEVNIKFHHLSLEDVIEIEKKTKI